MFSMITSYFLGWANEIAMLEHQHVSIQPSVPHGFKIDSMRPGSEKQALPSVEELQKEKAASAPGLVSWVSW